MSQQPRQPDPKHRTARRAAIALLTAFVVAASAWGWLYWGWCKEQRFLATLRLGFYDVQCDSIAPRLESGFPSADFVLYRVKGIKFDRYHYITKFSSLAQLTHLRSLSIDGGEVTDLSSLTCLPQLESLQLGGETSVTDFSVLAKLTNLRHIVLSTATVTDLSPLTHLTKLTMLQLEFTSVTDLSPLAGLTELQSLFLNHTKVTDLSPLIHLTKLRWLNLSGTSVTDVSPLVTLKSLRRLILSKETITEAQVKELQRALPDCNIAQE